MCGRWSVIQGWGVLKKICCAAAAALRIKPASCRGLNVHLRSCWGFVFVFFSHVAQSKNIWILASGIHTSEFHDWNFQVFAHENFRITKFLTIEHFSCHWVILMKKYLEREKYKHDWKSFWGSVQCAVCTGLLVEACCCSPILIIHVLFNWCVH